MKIAVKEWKMNQVKMDNRGIDFFFYIGEIEKETEKAYLLSFEACTLAGDDVIVKAWCPKSATMSVEEAQNEVAVKMSRYEQLIAFAKENGIKGVRKGLKAVTILQKIKQAGLVYNY